MPAPPKWSARDEIALVGERIDEVMPALAPIIERARSARRGQVRDQIEIGSGPDYRTYQVQLTREGSMTESKGYVVTLDDITDLLSAQRTGAWADVARRIAHEIKNPLTPIQLSAERLRRRYASKLADDFEVFDKCINTIIRQVGDIGRMVDEFSSFARMPEAKLEKGDLSDVDPPGGVPRKRAAAGSHHHMSNCPRSRSLPGSTTG